MLASTHTPAGVAETDHSERPPPPQQSAAPDAVSYRTAMHACMAGGEAERALRLSDKMREDGLAWDISTYNVVIKVRAVSVVGGEREESGEREGCGCEASIRAPNIHLAPL